MRIPALPAAPFLQGRPRGRVWPKTPLCSIPAAAVVPRKARMKNMGRLLGLALFRSQSVLLIK